VAIPMVSPGIPPFLGYFICGAIQEINVTRNLCGPPDGGRILWLPEFSGNAVILLCLRFIGGFASLLIYVPGVRSAMCTFVFEVIPCLLFFKDSLVQLREEVENAFQRSQSDITLRKYKELQLLISMFNERFQNEFFGKILACSILIMVSNGFILVSTCHLHPIVVMFGAPIILTEYVLFACIFSLASKVWIRSVEFKSTWIRYQKLSKRSSSAVKYGKSIQNLKIKVGYSNFIERNTPFVFLSFIIEQTVSLLLLNG
jgi:hypothetical protein